MPIVYSLLARNASENRQRLWGAFDADARVGTFVGDATDRMSRIVALDEKLAHGDDEGIALAPGELDLGRGGGDVVRVVRAVAGCRPESREKTPGGLQTPPPIRARSSNALCRPFCRNG